MSGGVLHEEIPRSRSVITLCFNGSKRSELRRHLHLQNTTPQRDVREVKRTIMDMRLNACGVRETARVLPIRIDYVIH
jgi:transposase-like protein